MEGDIRSETGLSHWNTLCPPPLAFANFTVLYLKHTAGPAQNPRSNPPTYRLTSLVRNATNTLPPKPTLVPLSSRRRSRNHEAHPQAVGPLPTVHVTSGQYHVAKEQSETSKCALTSSGDSIGTDSECHVAGCEHDDPLRFVHPVE